MSKSKKLALIGVIISTLNVLITVLSNGIDVWTKTSFKNSSDFLAFSIALILAIAVLSLPTFLEFRAFRRLDTTKEKPWRIFLLVMGILLILWFLLCLLTRDILGAILSSIQAVCFILVFALREKNQIARK